jgi:putative protein-disulfide isomerase
MNTATRKIEIVEFTDPVCTWCWGSEPVLRKLEARYGDQVEISFVMGGLCEDITSFYDSFNDIGGDPDRSNANIARHWLEASARHGMPVQAAGFKLFSREHRSTYPQNIAYKAAQMQDQPLADRFLRRVREASAAEAKQTNVTEVLVELASEVGLDVARFLEDFSNGAALKAFEEDLAMAARYNARGFPTFLVRYGDKETVLHGYKRYQDFQSVITHLSNGTIVACPTPANEETIMAFIGKHVSVAPIEIQTAFDLTEGEVMAAVDSLLAKRLIARRPAGNGYFISRITSSMACDPASGKCTV